MSQAAYTAHEGWISYPSYINLRQDGDAFVITVRGPEKALKDPALLVTGDHAEIRMDAAALLEWLADAARVVSKSNP